MRIFLTVILPLLAPTIIYFSIIYLKAKWRKEDEGAKEVPAYHTWPWVRLIGLGGVLAALVLLFMGAPTYEGFKGKYVPPQVIDGKLIQGHYIDEKTGEVIGDNPYE